MAEGRSPYLPRPEDLGDLLPDQPSYRVTQLGEWLYDNPVLDVDGMSNIPGAVRDRLRGHLYPFDVEIEQTADAGRTVKWLFRSDTGASVEAVLMGYAKRTTLCISSQAGCAMGCTFCATGQFGFERHLEAGEIAGQVAYANAYLRKNGLAGSPERVTNIVFMGMGEPLANYARVRESLRRMIETMGIGARSITVSTVGFVPGMRKLADEPWQVNLAVSLHAADDALRSTLVPLNDRYPLSEVIDACEEYREKKGRRVSIEWTMMDGVNDTEDQAHKLGRIARSLGAHVNVIALNPTPLTTDRPSTNSQIEHFIGTLLDDGVNVTRRDTRGQEIDAACGQLRVRADGGESTPVTIGSRPD